ncbi:Vacuolar protein sorting-associated protein 53 [Venturia inaequalis]|nr:Vacuolar protein sorting-associated protein 53 [Venturia inaequalis]
MNKILATRESRRLMDCQTLCVTAGDWVGRLSLLETPDQALEKEWMQTSAALRKESQISSGVGELIVMAEQVAEGP